jgi:hypothetical protein
MSLAQVQERIAALQAQFPGLAPAKVAGPSFSQRLQAVYDTSAAAPNELASGTDLGSQAVATAEQQVGTPYVFGGSRPGGFDCSGLVQWTYGRLGVSLPRTAAEQGKTGVPVPIDQAQPGDLVYFDKPGPVDHIGIYAGNGQWVVAPHTGSTVRVEPVDLSAATSIRRVTGAAPSLAPSTSGTAAGTDWSTALPPAGQALAGAIQQAASRTGIDPRLLASVAWTESDFDPRSTSSAGAQGVMQLMPQTAAGLGVDPLDPSQALLGGATYLKDQLNAFGGRVDLALAAYNAGPTAVRKAGGIPPYQETQDYVTRVLSRFQQLGGQP